jgi:hypothetical protein
MELLGSRIDWLSIGAETVPHHWLGEQKSGNSHYLYSYQDLKNDGIVILSHPRLNNVKMYQVQLQGRFWLNHKKEQIKPILDTLLNWQIQRYDYAVDYLGEWFSPQELRGTVSEWVKDNVYTGWLKRSRDYSIRNYDKTVESDHDINAFYGLSAQDSVKRFEYQINSQAIRRRKLGQDILGIESHVFYKMEPYFPAVFAGKKIPQIINKGKNPDQVILYWQRKIKKAKEKIKQAREKYADRPE